MQNQGEEGADLDAPILHLGCTVQEHLTRLWVKGVSRSARRLGEGVHGCVAPDGWVRACTGVWRPICAKVPDGETGERLVCATTWHGLLGGSGERPPVVQVCTMTW